MPSPSELRIMITLKPEEYELYKIAFKKWNMGKGKFGKQIILNWLFDNKLQLLRSKNEK
ncbi:MAG: hypothetical protein AABY32_03665 [Nanoarchaeota archaeon]